MPWHTTMHITVIEKLVKRGSLIDCLTKDGASPLMLACHMVYPHVVVNLLRHGACVNFPPVITRASRVSLTRTNVVRQDRGTAPRGSRETGPDRSRVLSEEADYIVSLLIDAGLTRPKKRFIQHSIFMENTNRQK